MSHDVTLGKLATESEGRDAIHIAVVPVIADVDLTQGQHVGVNADGTADPSAMPLVGIVDPYLLNGPRAGQRFWLCLYPKSITSLRHEWTHPAFPSEPFKSAEPEDDKAAAEALLRRFAAECGVSYDRFINAVDEDDYINMGENEEYKDVFDKYPGDQLQKAASLVLGKEIKSVYIFSCSC